LFFIAIWFQIIVFAWYAIGYPGGGGGGIWSGLIAFGSISDSSSSSTTTTAPSGTASSTSSGTGGGGAVVGIMSMVDCGVWVIMVLWSFFLFVQARLRYRQLGGWNQAKKEGEKMKGDAISKGTKMAAENQAQQQQQ